MTQLERFIWDESVVPLNNQKYIAGGPIRESQRTANDSYNQHEELVQECANQIEEVRLEQNLEENAASRTHVIKSE